MNNRDARLNYLWVGPPRVDSSGSLGSDVKDVIDMSKRCDNAISFFCLDEHLEHYKEIFKGNEKVTVCSIDAYIDKKKNDSNEEMRKHAMKMQDVRNELLKAPRDRIVDRVTFKDAFSLFLLANEGGYTLDTSVKLVEGRNAHLFQTYDSFRAPHIANELECWMMYASPNALNEPRKMLENYLSNWDAAQNIIRGKTEQPHNIMKFHIAITQLIIDSISIGIDSQNPQGRADPNWEFDCKSTQAGGLANFQTNVIPISKIYGNSHKPEKECREIIIKRIDSYLTQGNPNQREERKALIAAINNKIPQYKSELDLEKIMRYNNNMSEILECAKTLDNLSQRLNRLISFYSNGTDNFQKELAIRLDTAINQAYKSLADKVASRNLGMPERIIKDLEKQVKDIGEEAAQYHKKKHPILSNFDKSRFEKEILQSPSVRHR